MVLFDTVVAWFLLEGEVTRDDPAGDALFRRLFIVSVSTKLNT
jgi:hypothetical protein